MMSLQGCEEKDARKNERFIFKIEPLNSATFFEDIDNLITLKLDATGNKSTDSKLVIKFGDGSEYRSTKTFGTTEFIFGNLENAEPGTYFHVYEQPGQYNVVVAYDDGTTIADTTIVIHPAIRTLGIKTDRRDPLFIKQSATDYQVVFDLLTDFSPGHQAGMYNVSSDFFVTGTIQFDGLNTSPTEMLAALTSTGNLAVYDGFPGYSEYQKADGGHIYTQALSPRFPDVRTLTVLSDKTYIAWDSSGYRRLTVINPNGMEIRSFQVMKVPDNTTTPGYFSFTNTENLISFFNSTGGSKKTNLFVHDYAGVLKLEKTYDFHIFGVYPVANGYILVTSSAAGTNTEVKKTDLLGNILWTIVDDDAVGKSFFNADGNTYSFQGKFMNGVKIDPQGNIVWKKSFATSGDTFKSAVLNKDGNFVLVGSRTIDPVDPESSPEDYRDVIIMEIDKDGNIVDH